MLVIEPGEENWSCLVWCSSAAFEPCSGYTGKFWRPRPTHEPSMPLDQALLATSTCPLPHDSPKQCIQTSGLSHRATHTLTLTHTHTHDPEALPAHALKSMCLCWAAAAKFFAGSCVPCADQSNFPKLCQLCAGKGMDKCSCSHHEPYFGYSGAFKWVGPLLLSLMLGKLKNRE